MRYSVMNTQTILPPAPYEGTEPYLFVSYSHKNGEQVVWPIISAMQARGFRVWYDKGIQAGTEFNDIIAEKVIGCTVMLSFNTDELFASPYCKDELKLARNEHKNIINICFPLSEDPPAWYKLRFGSYQQIYRDRFDTEEGFLDELCRAKILQECRGVVKEKASDTPGEKREEAHIDVLKELRELKKTMK